MSRPYRLHLDGFIHAGSRFPPARLVLGLSAYRRISEESHFSPQDSRDRAMKQRRVVHLGMGSQIATFAVPTVSLDPET